MGISGFALENDAVAFVNDLRKILLRGHPAIAQCVAISETYLAPDA